MLLLLRIFQRQVADQCRFVLASVPMINKAVAKGDHDELWVGCQMFVVGAANVSKVLWGGGRNRVRAAPRRQPLRDSLGVDDTSPLYDVGMRNNFEHLDERIDAWWNDCPRHVHIDRIIGPPSAVRVSDLSEKEMFRVYDPATQSIVFWGQDFPLQPVATECDRLYVIAQREGSKPHWETSNRAGRGQ